MRVVAERIVISIPAGLCLLYPTYIALSVPPEHALLVNFILAPTLMGMVS